MKGHELREGLRQKSTKWLQNKKQELYKDPEADLELFCYICDVLKEKMGE